MENVDCFLTDDLISCACRRGDEYAWRNKDLLYVAEAAKTKNIASGGWQALFRTPDGDCELCWYSFYPDARQSGEPWGEYVGRTWEASRRRWRQLFEDEGLIEEGRKAFRLFQATELPGLLPRDALRFVLYFRSDRGGAKGQAQGLGEMPQIGVSP